MIRASNLEQSLDFYCNKLGFVLLQRIEAHKFRLTYVVLAADGDLPDAKDGFRPTIELIFNWDEQSLSNGRNFGHLAFEVENIYDSCSRLMELGVAFLRAPHDGQKAFISAPDSVVIELLQKGDRLPIKEPWASMKNPTEHSGN